MVQKQKTQETYPNSEIYDPRKKSDFYQNEFRVKLNQKKN